MKKIWLVTPPQILIKPYKIPLPLAKFIIPAPPLTVMLFEKPWALFKVGDQPRMKLIHFVIEWIMFYQYFYFQYVTLQKIILWYVRTICWQQTIKDFLKVNDTATPLGTCDISFSLLSNSHSHFHIKMAFDWTPLHKRSLVYRNNGSILVEK